MCSTRPKFLREGCPIETERVNILAVDDHPANLLALRAILDRPDYNIVNASSGEEALKHLLHEHFAVILLDVAMPVLDGFETATLIKQREKTRHIPIIFITAIRLGMEHIFQGYAVGGVDYLMKPIDPHALKSKVEVFVQIFRQARRIEQQSKALLAAEQRERELAEALYQDTFEEAPIGIGHTDFDGKWRRANRRLAEILGYRIDELLTRPLPELVHPDERSQLSETLRHLLDGTESRHCGEYRLIHRDGGIIVAVLRISLLKDREGKPVQLNIVEDITERRRTEDALHASEARFAHLLASGLLGVAFEDAAGVVRDANAAFLRLVQYSPDELLAGIIRGRDLTPPEFRDLDTRAFEEVRASGAAHTYEKEYARKDGTRIPVLVGVASAGLGAGIISFALDISERKERERERARVLRDLRDGIRARDDFLAIAAHEINTPLTPLRLQVQSLQQLAQDRRAVTPEILDRHIGPMARSLSRLERLMTTLLDVSRLTVGQLRLEREEVDLAAVVMKVIDRMRHEIEQAGCKLTLRVEKPIVGKWDPLRLEHVVSNLLSNAAKYGAGKPIEITTRADEQTAWLEVRDYGIGIAPEAQARIFERFERAVPVRHFSGFGLGLWIVRRVVEEHGGKVEVWSKPDEGARFTVQLPRDVPVPEQAS